MTRDGSVENRQSEGKEEKVEGGSGRVKGKEREKTVEKVGEKEGSKENEYAYEYVSVFQVRIFHV